MEVLPMPGALIRLLLAAFVVLLPSISNAENLKPFALAYEGPGQLEEKSAETKDALAKAGMEVVGDYSPYPGARIFVVTDNELRETAAKSPLGAFGAIQRISVTQVGEALQVAYTNPEYMAHAYRMEGNLSSTTERLRNALGFQKYFGSEDGLSEKQLRKYHYMFGMPYFDEPVLLARHKDYTSAVAAVEKDLSEGKGGTRKIYSVTIPGKEEAVYGVSTSHDEKIMGIIDKGTLKHTPFLCYEMVISGGDVYMLHGRFRIALNFPDLTMGTFTKIMSAPGDLEDALKAASE